MQIEIEYDGTFPNLCSGNLIVIIDGIKWEFGDCLCSGGSVTFDADYQEYVTQGPWSIKEWPKDFPEELEEAVLDAINEEIPQGCCGGCV